jgi:hypothetical protein
MATFWATLSQSKQSYEQLWEWKRPCDQGLCCWALAAASTAVDERGEPVYPQHSIVRKVSRVGNIGYLAKQITIGKRWAGARVRVIPVNGLVRIFYGEELVRALAVDPNGYHHPLRRRMRKQQVVR